MNPILLAHAASERDYPPPQRYYARVDSIENTGPEGADRLLQLDGVGADAFDSGYRGQPMLEQLSNLPLALMEVSSEQPDFPSQLSNVAITGRWVQVRILGAASNLRTPADGPTLTLNVDFYQNLFGAEQTFLSEISAVEKELASKLDDAFSLKSLPDASPERLLMLLNRGDHADFVLALDVGQGNANALWKQNHGAWLYFDFGGGVKANARTFPTKKFHPCFSQQPPIVLSHWDYDHWAGACRAPVAFDCDWIAPRDAALGVTHLAFAQELHRRGKLHLWPDDLGALATNHLLVERCTGLERNDRGLSMVLRTVHGHTLLMTGDASYDSIPAVKSQNKFHAVIASHHGALVTATERIAPAVGTAVLIYSVGHGNYFGHPPLRSCLNYLEQGWAPARTAATSERIMKRPNNIAISFNGVRPQTGCTECQPRTVMII